MRTNTNVLDIIESNSMRDALKKIENSDVETLTSIILHESKIDHALRIKALLRLHKELLDGEYGDLVAQLIFLCYSTENHVLKVNIINFLNQPIVLRLLLEKEQNPIVFDLIAGKIVEIWRVYRYKTI